MTDEAGEVRLATTSGLNVNLREGPDIDSPIETVLPGGTELEVLGQKNDWLHVRHESNLGFVYAGFVRYLDEKETVIPSGLLQRGMQGEAVRTAQEALNRQGFELEVDGNFGREMFAAVTSFQSKRDLRADGVVGPDTWSALTETGLGASGGAPGDQSVLTAYLLKWNPRREPESTITEFVEIIRTSSQARMDWSSGNRTNVVLGSRVYLMRTSVEPKGIVGVGEVVREVERIPHWDEAKRLKGKTSNEVGVLWSRLDTQPFISLDELKSQTGETEVWESQTNGVELRREVSDALDRLLPLEPREVSTHATSDLWTAEDRLGYSEYARAIYHFISDPRTQPPLTISIQAPWGGGKTSLMRMIQKELDLAGYELASGTAPGQSGDAVKARVKDILLELSSLSTDGEKEIKVDLGDESKCLSVWFNAWRYQSSDQIWAGLAEAIIRGVTDRLEPVEREKFLLRLHLMRVGADRVRSKVYNSIFQKFYDMCRGLGLFALAALLGILSLLWNLNFSNLATAAGLVGLPAGVWLIIRNAAKATELEPASLTLSDYLEVPDYSENLGLVHHVTEDLRRVFELLPQVENGEITERVPLLIFVDDLDRCAPQKVAEVFEAINLFIAGEFPDCFIVMGMDTEVVAAGLEEAHKDVIRRLPTYARKVPVGWRFMDKFVQLPFVIPPLDDTAIIDYLDYLAASEDIDAREIQAVAAKSEISKVVDDLVQKGFQEGAEEDDIVKQAVDQILTDKVNHSDAAVREGQRLATEKIKATSRKIFIDKRARDFQSDNQKLVKLLASASDDFSHNPRDLKRLANVYRFYYNLRLAREARGDSIPTEGQLENWLKLSLGWPEVVRWLRRSVSDWAADLDPKTAAASGIGYKLRRMEELTVEGDSDADASVRLQPAAFGDWIRELASEFGAEADRDKLNSADADMPWLNDERLFLFFRRMAQGPASKRLSVGAGTGFW